MIIEFFGTPGAGKTFLATQLIQTLSYEGINAKNIVEIGRISIKYKAINKFVRYIINIIPKYVALKKKLINIVVEYSGRAAKHNDKSLDDFIDNIVYYSFLYQYFKERDGLTIFDEGILHQYVNIMANYDVPVDIIQKLHEVIPYVPAVVYVCCSDKTCLSSVRKRNRHVCYIDELVDQELADCISDYCTACELVKSILKPITVMRENNIEKNIIIIRESVGI